MRYLSVCSGMEAASVAWHPLGWKPVGFSEIEPFPCAILKHRFPNTHNYGSLTDYAQWPIEQGAVDLLVGGTPCQSFSVAGLRKGLEDPRGNLALVFLGLADKLKPRWIVWENVPGVLSSNGGRDFGSFLGALVQLGYGFAYRVLDAQHFGVPQRRRRVFVVACLGDWRAPAEVLFEPDCVRRDTKKGRAKGQGAAARAEGGVDANGLQRTVGTLCADTHPGAYSGQDAYTGRLIPCPDNDSVGTLCARDFKGVGNQFVQEGKCIPCSEQPLPIAFKVRGGGNCSGIKGGEVKPGIGGGVGYLGAEDKTFTVATTQDQWVAAPIPFRKSKRAQSDKDDETWVEGDVSNTLNNFDLGDTRTTHAVVGPIAIQGTIIGRGENAGPQGTGATKGGPMFTLTKTDIHGVAHCSDVAPTVTSSGPPYSRTGNERVEAEALVAFQPGNLRRQAEADPSTETFPTLKCDAGDQSPHVAYAFDGYNQTVSQISQTIRADKSDCDHIGMVATPMAVRRLTPVECERLQGFPDNWSRIPWKGKPEEECPDGPRYKACGNSMAVPVMRWIGERIAAVEARNISRP